MEADREGAFVHAFVVPEKRDRCLSILASPRRRTKVLGELYHSLSTVAARTTRIENRDHSPEFVERLLKRKGAGATCYLISPEKDLDQQEMPLREALDRLILSDGVAVACCVPGRLAYYKAERTGYILQHRPEAA